MVTKRSVQSHVTVDALLEEDRVFEPSREFKKKAFIKDPSIYEEANKNREVFWAKCAQELTWFKKWDRVLEWKVRPWR